MPQFWIDLATFNFLTFPSFFALTQQEMNTFAPQLIPTFIERESAIADPPTGERLLYINDSSGSNQMRTPATFLLITSVFYLFPPPFNTFLKEENQCLQRFFFFKKLAACYLPWASLPAPPFFSRFVLICCAVFPLLFNSSRVSPNNLITSPNDTSATNSTFGTPIHLHLLGFSSRFFLLPDSNGFR